MLFFLEKESDSTHPPTIYLIKQFSHKLKSTIVWCSNNHGTVHPLIEGFTGCFGEQCTGMTCCKVDSAGTLSAKILRANRIG